MPITQIFLTAATVSGPTYTLTPAANNVNEGSELTFTVGGTNITNGTYYWNTNGGDLVGFAGEVIITDNSGSFSVTPTADNTTEGSETFTATLRSGSVEGTILATSESITINDTSLTPEPTYTITPAADNVDEGSSLEFTVGGTDITNGTYYWTIETGAGEFATADGTVVVTDNSGTFSVTPTEDVTTEGEQTFTVALRSVSITGTILQTSSSITINDTSLSPTYTLTPAANNVDEGSSLEFTVGGTNIINGTYYWTIETGAYWNIATTDGTVVVTDNLGTFSVTPTADVTTEGEQTFTVALRSVSITGTILETSESITINDTSLTPVAPFSLVFNNSQNDYLDVAGSSDFNLGTTWTIEFWMSANSSSINADGGIWGLLNQVGWSTTNNIVVALSDAKLVFLSAAESANADVRYTEPTPNGVPSGVTLVTASTGSWESNPLSNLATTGGTGTGLRVNVSYTGGYASTITIATAGSGYTNGETIVVDSGTSSAQFTISVNSPVVWTHVAIVNDSGTQKVYYNGVEQTKVSGTFGTASYTNGTDPLRIGRLGPQNGGTFDGKMAMIRISNTAKYSTAFTPSTTYDVETDTVLFLDSDTPLIGQSYFELNGVTISVNGGNNIFINKEAYPNLDTQIQIGDTVVNVSDPSPVDSVVAGAVYSADPANWGVPITPGWGGASTVNFSGTRSAPVTNNGTTESESFPATYTVRQWLGSYSGPANSDIFVLIADYPDAATIPAGATAVINGTVVALENNASGTYSGQAVRQLGFLPQGTIVNAGTTITFTWTT